MCENVFFLSFLFIIKLLVLFIIPIIVILFKRVSILEVKGLFYFEIIFIIIFFILSSTNNLCNYNSNIIRLIKLNRTFNLDSDTLIVDTNSNIIEPIEKFQTYDGKQLYYFNQNSYNLSNRKMVCENDYDYFKNFGNNITAISIAVSTVLNQNISPVDVYNLALENNLIECSKGVDISNLLEIVKNQYNVDYYLIDSSDFTNYVLNGKIIILETYGNSNSKKLLNCNVGYEIVYNIDSRNQFVLSNPNDKENDYICPENSLGFGNIVQSKTNEKFYTFSDINNQTNRYIVVESR